MLLLQGILDADLSALIPSCVQVSLQTPHLRAPYLPGWLSSPLGRRRSDAEGSGRPPSSMRASHDSETPMLAAPPHSPPLCDIPPSPSSDPLPRSMSAREVSQACPAPLHVTLQPGL